MVHLNYTFEYQIEFLTLDNNDTFNYGSCPNYSVNKHVTYLHKCINDMNINHLNSLLKRYENDIVHQAWKLNKKVSSV